jgi:acyl-CoA synthetase (AMP-forming)/AMP-acid ligase II
MCISGRAKKLIIGSNGKNVYPEEIEETLMTQIPYTRNSFSFPRKTLGHEKRHHRVLSRSQSAYI